MNFITGRIGKRSSENGEQKVSASPQSVRGADDYYNAFRTHWDKLVQEFVIAEDYASERYDYTSTDTPVADGTPVIDSGWGLVVYHRESDGVWRVARDAFGPDHPPAAQ